MKTRIDFVNKMATVFPIKALAEQNEFEFKLIDDGFLSISPLNEKIYIRFGFDSRGKHELRECVTDIARAYFDMSFTVVHCHFENVHIPERVVTEDGVFTTLSGLLHGILHAHTGTVNYDCIAFIQFKLDCREISIMINCVEWIHKEPMSSLVYPNKIKLLETELSDVKKRLSELEKMFKDVLGLVDKTNEEYVEAKSRFEQAKE